LLERVIFGSMVDGRWLMVDGTRRPSAINHPPQPAAEDALPMDPATLLGLLRLAEGDEGGALAAARQASAEHPLLPTLIDVSVRHPSRAYTIRRLNRLLDGGSLSRGAPAWS